MPSELETRVMRKISFRIVPFIMLLYFIAFIDRVNIGFAALTMNKDLGFSPAVFGLGAGIFFVGYFLFEVPSNLILNKVGARLWIARVMITWGIISAIFAFIQGETSFLILRFLLGVAEAGFFPGIILISQLLVSCALPRRGGFTVHGCCSHIGGSRLTAFECFVGDGRLAWPPGLAVDVHYGSHPGIPSWLRRPGLHDGQAGKGDVVEG